MQLTMALRLAAPAAFLARSIACAQAPKIMDSPPSIPVYKDRIVGGEPNTGAVNGTSLPLHPLKASRRSPKTCCATCARQEGLGTIDQ